jgi:pimeloyl-ACP methyl ester carboxylesterase
MDLVGDMVGVVAELGEKQATIVGHDWGATVAWHAALLRPDVFPAVAAMSVPYRQRGPALHILAPSERRRQNSILTKLIKIHR